MPLLPSVFSLRLEIGIKGCRQNTGMIFSGRQRGGKRRKRIVPIERARDEAHRKTEKGHFLPKRRRIHSPDALTSTKTRAIKSIILR